MKSKRPRRMRQRREQKLKITFRRVTWVASAFVGILAICLTMFFHFSSNEETYAAVTGEYRSKASGNWNATGTWQRYNGSSWVNATATPVSTDDIITIQSGHTVTVTANVTADQIVVASGGTLVLNSGKTLTLNNGTGVDLSINGTITNAGVVTLNSSATMEVNNNGVYQHNYTGTKGAIPIANWKTGSTCEIIGYTTVPDGPDNNTQAFYNYTWNTPLLLTDVKIKGDLTTINGDFKIVTTGVTGSINLNDKDTYTLNIGGDFTFTAGTLTLSDKSGSTPILNVAGDYSQAAGIFNITNKSNTTATMNVSGNWTHTAGTISASGSNAVATVNFKKAGTQTFNTVLPIVTGSVDFNVNSGSTLSMGNSLMIGRNFTLSSGGTLQIGALTGLLGNIGVSGTKTYSSGGSYIYSGAAAQNLGVSGALTVKDLTINTGGTAALASDVTVTGTLNLVSGKINTGSNTLYITNTSTSSLTGYSSSDYIIGNLNRSVSSSGTYDFPLGTTTKYEPATLTLSSIAGVNNITAKFTNSDPTDSHGVDAINVDGTDMQELLNYGYWTLTPNSSLTAGTYSLETEQKGYSNIILDGTVYTLVRRANTSSDWENLGTHNISDQSMSGTTINTKRTGLNKFGIFAVAIGDYGSFSNPTLKSGTAGAANAVYLFPNVVRGVDAWVTIMSLNNGATLDEIDDASVGYNSSFQPFINYPANKTAYIEWKFVFKKAGTSIDTTLKKLTATGVDVDGMPSGSKSIREFIEATMPTSYNLDPYTTLTVTNYYGNYRAVGDDINLNDIDSTRKSAMYELNYQNVNTLMYRTGAINTLSSSEVRQTSLFFKSFNLTNRNIALPIKLIYFNANLKDNAVDLTWATASEINNDYFTIERSTDGEHFEPITTKRGAGNSTVQLTYSTTDNHPLQGYSYYRLKQTDFDGHFTYSDVKTVKKTGGDDVQDAGVEIKAISPNPFSENFKIDFILKEKAEVEISMMSVKGEVIFKESVMADDGYNSYDFTDQKGLTSGYYFVTISHKGGKVTKKIMKQ